MILISAPRSSRWVAKLWRRVCRHTPFLMPAPSAASWNSRLSWRVVIGWPDWRPGNSQRFLRGGVFDLQPDHFAGSQAAAIAKTERDAGLEARGNSQHATRLVWTHHLRDLLGLAEGIDLGCKIQPPPRHAKKKIYPSHDA